MRRPTFSLCSLELLFLQSKSSSDRSSSDNSSNESSKLSSIFLTYSTSYDFPRAYLNNPIRAFSSSEDLLVCLFFQIRREMLCACRQLLDSVIRGDMQWQIVSIIFPKLLEAATGGVQCKKVFLKISQNSQKNTCVEVF